MKTKSALLAVAILSLTAGLTPAGAQLPTAIDQVATDQQRRDLDQATQLRYDQGNPAPELYPGEADDVGPQSVLSLKPRRTFFEGAADSQYYFTDNAFLDHSTRVSSGVLVSTAQFDVAPTPFELGDGTYAPRLGFREQWFDFFQYGPHDPTLSTYDFNAQTAFLDEHWTLRQWTFGAGFDYTRLLTTSQYRQFYSEYVPRWEATRLFSLGRHQVLSLGYQGFYHFTGASQFRILPQSGFFNRLDQLLLASYSWEPCANVILQPYYSFRYTRFTSTVNRDDYLNSVGAGIYYFFNQNFSGRLFVSYDQRFSSIEAAGYHDLGAGAGVNFVIRF